jgi:hypothetical protein
MKTGNSFDPTWKNDLISIFNNKSFHDEILINHKFNLLQSQSFHEFLEESFNLFLKRDITPRDQIEVMKFPSLQCCSTFQKSQEVIVLSYAIDNLLQYYFSISQPIFQKNEKIPLLENLLNHSKNYVNKFSLEKENISFIDIGAGKGYFSIFMSNEM